MTLHEVLTGPGPVLALAPMQDITDLEFWRLMAGYGGADLYFTEFFRVTEGYRPERAILRSILENPTGRPAIAQIIGNDPVWMARTAQALEKHPTCAIDLNLGCPAPVVYRKCAGGGLLRDPARIDSLLAVLRTAIRGAFTVKTRLGFEDPAEFDRLLDVFGAHAIDLLTVHGRTVGEKYGPVVHEDRIAEAVRRLSCPVLANGNVTSAAGALRTLEHTGARGLMIGRGAIRNPWIFRQIREVLAGREPFQPFGRDVREYVQRLWEATTTPDVGERSQVQHMKKYANFLGEGIGAGFLHEIRRATSRREFFEIVERHTPPDEPMSLDPTERAAAVDPTS
ncbi:MAG: tRNA-dihydrouridine synthase family protein [Terrimicrobiaceae bacterium]|nr:tRNA-dihydrouridine synthase family protein [Terrimicrobiaceae bacterium]